MFTFQESIFYGFRLMFDYFGKATRSEFWWFTLFVMLTYLATLVVSIFFAPFIFVFFLEVIVFAFAQTSLLFRRVRDAIGNAWPVGIYFLSGMVLNVVFYFKIGKIYTGDYVEFEKKLRVLFESGDTSFQFILIISVLIHILILAIFVMLFLPSKK